MFTSSFKRKLSVNEGNCLIYGCASMVVIGIIGAVLIGFGTKYFLDQLRDEYTDDAPVELAVVEVSDSERDSLIASVDTWMEALDEGATTEPLTLTDHDINVLIQHHEELEGFSDKVFITIKDSTITGDVSVPLEEVPGLSGRYFNGSADFEIALDRMGRLSVYATAASLKGKPIPDNFMQGMKNENLAKDVSRNNPDIQESLDKIEFIEVVDGKIIITPVGATSSESEEE
jgi:hypothetical protein